MDRFLETKLNVDSDGNSTSNKGFYCIYVLGVFLIIGSMAHIHTHTHIQQDILSDYIFFCK